MWGVPDPYGLQRHMWGVVPGSQSATAPNPTGGNGSQSATAPSPTGGSVYVKGPQAPDVREEHQLLRSVRSDTQAVSKRGGCERSSGAGL